MNLSSAQGVGLYGKLPAHGDFVSRNLPSRFINTWDDWLQRFVASTQEQLGGAWLDIYLTSPIWRFAFSTGVLDENAWAGIMIPSVDRVGRYFPFSIITQLSPSVNCVALISDESQWFAGQEELALRALDGSVAVDELHAELQVMAPPNGSTYQRNSAAAGWRESSGDPAARHVAINMDFEEQRPSSTFPYLLDWLLASRFASYSVWHTAGSQRVQPSFLLCQGLPETSGATAMLDGGWSEWRWDSPYVLLPQPFADTPRG